MVFLTETSRVRPNPRLQRTPSAAPPSPLRRQPLGAGEHRVVSYARIWIFPASSISAAGCVSAKLRDPGWSYDGASAAVLTVLADESAGFGVVFACLERDIDPPEATMEHIANASQALVKPCCARLNSDDPNRPIDRDTGRRGVTVFIRHVRRISLDEYEMDGGYYFGILCAAEYRFRVRKSPSGWRVALKEGLWMS